MPYRPIVCAMIVALVAISCDKGGESDAELRQTLAEKEAAIQRLTRRMDEKDRYIREVTRNINSIQDKLRSITESEASVVRIQGTDPEKRISPDQISEIAQNVDFMENAITQSKRELESLRGRMRTSHTRIGELDTMVANLEKTVIDKEMRIGELTERVVELERTVETQGQTIVQHESQIATQRTTIEEQRSRISAQEIALHTVRWISGSTGDLQRQGILHEAGGFLGFGETWQLTPQYNAAARIPSYRSGYDGETTEIVVQHRANRKIVRLLPEREHSLYRVDRAEGGSKLVVLNAEEFWRDKWLVMVIGD